MDAHLSKQFWGPDAVVVTTVVYTLRHFDRVNLHNLKVIVIFIEN